MTLIADYGPTFPEPIVAIYPQDGTIVATHPFAVLDGAPWVSPQQAGAAEVFRKYLLSSERQSVLPQFGFRPADPSAVLGPPLDAAHGVDSRSNLALAEVPTGEVINAIIRRWEDIRSR